VPYEGVEMAILNAQLGVGQLRAKGRSEPPLQQSRLRAVHRWSFPTLPRGVDPASPPAVSAEVLCAAGSATRVRVPARAHYALASDRIVMRKLKHVYDNFYRPQGGGLAEPRYRSGASRRWDVPASGASAECRLFMESGAGIPIGRRCGLSRRGQHERRTQNLSPRKRWVVL
jgi:hypothetical protein